MLFALLNLLMVTVLFVATLALQRYGRWIGERELLRQPDLEREGFGPAGAAVSGLLSLFLAFTFSGAASRFDARRHLVVQEANAIGTAWLRIDVMPESSQGRLRDLFRQYADARIGRYQNITSAEAEADDALALRLQREIWSTASAAANAAGQVAPFSVFLPSLNEMIDITTTRSAALRMHPPIAVFAMLAVMMLIGAVFVGYGGAGKSRSWLQTIGFAGVLTMAIYVTVDFEFPRMGLIRVDAIDSLLVDVRRSMN